MLVQQPVQSHNSANAGIFCHNCIYGGQELCIVSIVGQFGIPETTENGGKG